MNAPTIDKPQPFFADDGSRNRLVAIARQWLGTPFAPHACIRGAGVDCVHLCAAIYIEAGFLERFSAPKYTLDGGNHAPKSLVAEWLREQPQFKRLSRLPWPGLEVGDLLTFDVARGTAWHVGLFLGGSRESFVHAVAKLGAVEGFVSEAVWSTRLAAIYRPVRTS